MRKPLGRRSLSTLGAREIEHMFDAAILDLHYGDTADSYVLCTAGDLSWCSTEARAESLQAEAFQTLLHRFVLYALRWWGNPVNFKPAAMPREEYYAAVAAKAEFDRNLGVAKQYADSLVVKEAARLNLDPEPSNEGGGLYGRHVALERITIFLTRFPPPKRSLQPGKQVLQPPPTGARTALRILKNLHSSSSNPLDSST